jgi:structural maintenance of chromosomes protein 5
MEFDDSTGAAGSAAAAVDHSTYGPASIMKIELTNFMTHQHTVITPSAAVNFILGANGSGKSSVVCALCLGLGGTPSNMERGGDLKGFVMNGKESAKIKLTLKGRPGDNGDWEITRIITRNKSANKWIVNGEETASEDVLDFLRNGMSINMDNFCMFLPQERVGNFTKMNSGELLISTMQAASKDLFNLYASVVTQEKNSGTDEKELQRTITELAEAEKQRGALNASSNDFKNLEDIKTKIKLLSDLRLPYTMWKAKDADAKRAEQEKDNFKEKLVELQMKMVPPQQKAGLAKKKQEEAEGDRDEAVSALRSHLQGIDSLKRQLDNHRRDIVRSEEQLRQLEKGKDEKLKRIADNEKKLEIAKGNLEKAVEKAGTSGALEKLEKEARAELTTAQKQLNAAQEKGHTLQEKRATLFYQRTARQRQLDGLESYIYQRLKVSYSYHRPADLLTAVLTCQLILSAFSGPSSLFSLPFP